MHQDCSSEAREDGIVFSASSLVGRGRERVFPIDRLLGIMRSVGLWQIASESHGGAWVLQWLNNCRGDRVCFGK